MQKNMIQIELHHSGIKMVNTSQMRHHDLLLKYKVIKKDSEKKNLKIICSIWKKKIIQHQCANI